MVPQPDLRSDRSRYMSRHLDQTGPSVTIGTRVAFTRPRRELMSQLHLSLPAPHTQFQASACPGPSSCAVPVSPGLEPGPELALAACRVTSSRGLSLPLISDSSSLWRCFPLPPKVSLYWPPPVTLKHLFLFNSFLGVEFQFFNVCLMFLCGWIHINSWDSRQTSNQRFQSKYIQSWPFLSSVSEFRLTEAVTALLDWRESAFNLMFRSNGPPAPLWSCSLKLIVWL